MKTNREGMTWREWILAACAWGSPVDPGTNSRIGPTELLQAWKDGEDPTEYAASTERGLGDDVDCEPKYKDFEWVARTELQAELPREPSKEEVKEYADRLWDRHLFMKEHP